MLVHAPFFGWKDVKIRQLVENQPVFWINAHTAAEEACQIFAQKEPSLLLIRKSPSSHSICGILDDTDFVSFLPYCLGFDEANENNSFFQVPVSVTEEKKKEEPCFGKRIMNIGMKSTFTTVSADTCLSEVSGIFGAGILHVAVKDMKYSQIIGVVSQQQFIKFLWDNYNSFFMLENVFHMTMRDFNIGHSNIVSIGGDKLVIEAIEIMQKGLGRNGVFSIAVIDFHRNVLGSISIMDIKYAIKFGLESLFKTTCAHFLSVIKYEQGLKDGKDSAPHFFVTENSTLSYVIAKFVATGCHSLWLIRDFSQPSTPISSASSVTASPYLLSQPCTNTLSTTPTAVSPISSTQMHGVMFSNLEFLRVITFTDICALIAKIVNNSFDTFQVKWRRASSSSSSMGFNCNKASLRDTLKRNMIFREEPPKRYSLNDSETDSQNDDIDNEIFGEVKVKKKIQNNCEIKCINPFPDNMSDVVITSELFLCILKQFPGEKESKILFQFSENISVKLFFIVDISLYCIVFPNNIPVEMCYQVSCYIFDHLTFKRVFLLATVFQWSVTFPVSFLCTTSSSLNIENKGYSFLKPPALLSGMEASILSLCEKRNLDAIAIIASSHGPKAHLQITVDVSEQVADILDKLFAEGKLGLKTRLQNYNTNVKKRTNVSTMYL
ncbi:hypothetical protein PORY_002325 [Pneumocystis oryctolagi]|uniref:Uncharacterized protein n=1 Tax=Pneumocystis oryctolagi TaxID=42067 RepID=A0ACB7CAE4_9ASCO|nr:hypothetical protein PORY_002325 [Pneumocystis oryctolagi]